MRMSWLSPSGRDFFAEEVDWIESSFASRAIIVHFRDENTEHLALTGQRARTFLAWAGSFGLYPILTLTGQPPREVP